MSIESPKLQPQKPEAAETSQEAKEKLIEEFKNLDAGLIKLQDRKFAVVELIEMASEAKNNIVRDWLLKESIRLDKEGEPLDQEWRAKKNALISLGVDPTKI